MGDAHKYHFSSRHRAPGGVDFGDAFEQHLPRAREYPHRELLRAGASVRALDLDERAVIGHCGHDLHAGDEMGEIGKIGQYRRGIGARVVLRAQFGERRGDIAAHQRLDQLDHPRPVGQPQHLPHVLGAHRPSRMRDGLIQ